MLTTLLSYHLLTLFVNIFFPLPSTFFLSFLLSFHSLYSFIFFIFLLVAGVWFSSGCYLAGIWRSSGYNLASIWFLLPFFHPLHHCTAAFYFGSGYFGTYYLYKKIPLFYKQNLFIAVIYFLEPYSEYSQGQTDPHIDRADNRQY